MESDTQDVIGYARRSNGTCEANEVDCGSTARGQYACCPIKSFCDRGFNTICCPLRTENCTDELLPKPHCADSTWKMYNNTQPFCCNSTAVAGFKTGAKSNICADPGFQPLEGDLTLEIIPQVWSSSSSSPSNESHGADANTEKQSSNNTGAIAGGVVGGVVGLAIIVAMIWFFLRRRSQQQESQQPMYQGPPERYALGQHPGMWEKDGTADSQVQTVWEKYGKEAPAGSPATPELDANEQHPWLRKSRSPLPENHMVELQ